MKCTLRYQNTDGRWAAVVYEGQLTKSPLHMFSASDVDDAQSAGTIDEMPADVASDLFMSGNVRQVVVGPMDAKTAFELPKEPS